MKMIATTKKSFLGFKLIQQYCFLLLFLLTASSSFAQCPTQDLVFRNQSEVDNFIIQYPNCTQLTTKIFIGEWGANSNITNLNGFQNITTILEDIKIEFNNNLINLSGLNNLNTVTGIFWIYGNNNLLNFNGLQGLTSIGERMTIEANLNLETFQGLNNLQTIGGSLDIDNSYKVTSLEGFDNLTSVGALRVSSMDALTSLNGLENLTNLGDYVSLRGLPITTFTPIIDNVNANTRLQINFCSNLTDLQGLSSLITVKKLSLTFNPNLTTLDGLQNLTTGSIALVENNMLTDISALSNFSNPTDIQIAGNDLLNSLDAFSDLTTIQGNLQIVGNDLLNDLEGLNNLTTIEEDFQLGTNGFVVTLRGNVIVGILNYPVTAIDNLSALSNLTYVGGDLLITDNPGLTSLQGLNNLVTVGQRLDINNTESLASLVGLDALTNISSLDLSENQSLVNVNGLNNIQSIPAFFTIEENNVLTDISGLSSLQMAGFVNILGNPVLDFCNYEYLCEVFAQMPSGLIPRVEDNGSNCTVGIIESFCNNNTLTLTCPPSVEVLLQGGVENVFVSWVTPVATSNCEQGGVSINQASGPLSGEQLTAGTYVATYEAIDACGGTASCSIDITIVPETEPGVCIVNVTTADGDIVITGLTSEANTKLFDSNISSVWECNPWNGSPCTANEVINALPEGNYFLSVQSDNCSEWIPITVTGGNGCVDNDGDGFCAAEDCDDNNSSIPATPGTSCNDNNENTENDVYGSDGCTCVGTPIAGGCNVNVTQTSGTQLTVTGLTTSANTKLFDSSASNIVWECNPWDAGVCSSTEVIDLDGSETVYYLAVQSENCNEWIPINIMAAMNGNVQAFQSNEKATDYLKINNVFPIPGDDEVFMTFESSDEKELMIAFYDVVGKLSRQYQVAIDSGLQTIQLDVSNLNAGLYHISVMNELGELKTERFVKR